MATKRFERGDWWPPMSKLDYLFRRSRNRLINLREVSCSMPRFTHEAADKAASYICIEALNLLGEFNRSYYSLALVRWKLGLALSSPQGFLEERPIHDALRSINRLKNPHSPGPIRRRDEPSWHTKSQFLDVIARSALNTEPQIRGALSLPVRVLDDLPTARNFFAHRNGETAQKWRDGTEVSPFGSSIHVGRYASN